MDKEVTTAERPVSRPKEEVIREAKRIEESLLYSSKGHFAASHFWSKFHLWVGVPMVILSGVAGASALSKFDSGGTIAGLLSIVVVTLSSVMTFLNPNEKANAHLSAGNQYDALMNKVRMFWSIECWRNESDDVLAEKLAHLSDQKDKLNQDSPQIPRRAYNKARKGIQGGEAEYRVDKI